MKRILVTGGSGFIGTNLIEYFKRENIEVVNIDIAQPRNIKHKDLWIDCDINDKIKITKILSEYNPTHIIHLAARADSGGRTLEDYKTNILGTRNVLEASATVKSMQRLIVASSQFVHYKKGVFPENDNDYHPYTTYGKSKVITEQIIKEGKTDFAWTIIRPTRIWGYWQSERTIFYKMLKKGAYIHPGRKPVQRAFGYVGNLIYYVNKILNSSAEIVNKKVFYIGDPAINLIDWIEGFSSEIAQKRIIYLPRGVVAGIGKVGDMVKYFGGSFPIDSYRYNSLIENDDAPVTKTIEIFGKAPYNLEAAIKETVQMLRKYEPEIFS